MKVKKNQIDTLRKNSKKKNVPNINIMKLMKIIQ